MTPRTLAVVSASAASVAVLAFACGPVQEPPSPVAPVNSCPAHPCTAYRHQAAAPSCDATGVCAVPVPAGALVLVVTLAQDSAFAQAPLAQMPSTQYVMPYEHLADCRTDLQEVCDPTCVWPGCGHLPAPALVQGGYLMSPCVQSVPAVCPNGLGFFLGNIDPQGGGIEDTWLPVHATFRLLEDPWGTDVTALGLPVQPVVAAQIINTGTANAGPNGGPAYAYEVALPLGTYERTVSPDPPYDAVFGPAVGSDSIVGSVFESGPMLSVQTFDDTNFITDVPTLPTFDITADFPLDGWTAFLRDPTTHRPLSNVRVLGGMDTSGVRLVSKHGQPDALLNAQIVIAPPSGAPYPTAVFEQQGMQISSTLKYPSFAPRVGPSVTVYGKTGSAIDADVVFEALGFIDALGAIAPDKLFEFTGIASPRPSLGESPPKIDLPQGPYRVDVIPRDGISAMLVQNLVVGASDLSIDLHLRPLSTVSGSAVLSDGRALAGAIVEALPVSCAAAPELADAAPPSLLKELGTTPSCLPRPAQVTTGSDGSFELPVDPGGYTLRVRPASGTALPWATQTLSVTGNTKVSVTVAAPFHASFRLVDPNNTPVVHALVKAFHPTPPSAASGTSGAVELGEALTDTTGQCDLYMALPQ